MVGSQSTGLSGSPGTDIAQVFEWHTLALGDVYLLLTPLEVGDGLSACEAHLIAPRTSTKYRAMRFRYGSSDFRLDAGELSILDINEYAKQWAEGELEGDLLNWVREQAPGAAYPPPPKLAPARKSLAALWLSRWEPDVLRVIHDRTGNSELRTYLEKLFELPPVVSQPLGS